MCRCCWRGLAGALLVLAIAATACSPEVGRTRSSGPGADPGNRGLSVELHGQLNPFFHTPAIGKAIQK